MRSAITSPARPRRSRPSNVWEPRTGWSSPPISSKSWRSLSSASPSALVLGALAPVAAAPLLAGVLPVSIRFGDPSGAAGPGGAVRAADDAGLLALAARRRSAGFRRRRCSATPSTGRGAASARWRRSAATAVAGARRWRRWPSLTAHDRASRAVVCRGCGRRLRAVSRRRMAPLVEAARRLRRVRAGRCCASRSAICTGPTRRPRGSSCRSASASASSARSASSRAISAPVEDRQSPRRGARVYLIDIQPDQVAGFDDMVRACRARFARCPCCAAGSRSTASGRRGPGHAGGAMGREQRSRADLCGEPPPGRGRLPADGGPRTTGSAACRWTPKWRAAWASGSATR